MTLTLAARPTPLTRAVVEHARSCDRPGWRLDTSPSRFGLVVARCTRCGTQEWRAR
jgi:exosome complex RNA-binding protein Csl4